MTAPPRQVHRARAILDVAGKTYPGAWSAIEHFRLLRGDSLPDWPEWCYAPLAAAYAVVSGGGENRVPLSRAHHIGVIGALSAWRLGQHVIRFDPALYAPLIETPISGDLPTSLLYRLPAWCLYVETPDLVLWGRRLHGFWVHLEWSEGARDELRLLLDMADTPDLAFDAQRGVIPLPVILGHGSVADALQAVVESSARQAAIAGYGVAPSLADPARVAAVISPILSLVLYLCSEAPDWAGAPPENPKPIHTRRGGWKLFPASAVKPWDVGTRLGAALRRAYHAAEVGDPGADPETDRARPRAHIRRAHWHTFLRGAGRAERTLRWLPPIPVNLADIETLPTTIRSAKP